MAASCYETSSGQPQPVPKLLYWHNVTWWGSGTAWTVNPKHRRSEWKTIVRGHIKVDGYDVLENGPHAVVRMQKIRYYHEATMVASWYENYQLNAILMCCQILAGNALCCGESRINGRADFDEHEVMYGLSIPWPIREDGWKLVQSPRSSKNSWCSSCRLETIAEYKSVWSQEVGVGTIQEHTQSDWKLCIIQSMHRRRPVESSE